MSGDGVESIYADETDASEVLREAEGGDRAVHLYLKDDKEWWLAHNPDLEVPGRFNGNWLLWTTYPSGPWSFDYLNRPVAHTNVDELWYVDYDGNDAHSIHEAKSVPIDEAPEFVRAEFDDWRRADGGEPADADESDHSRQCAACGSEFDPVEDTHYRVQEEERPVPQLEKDEDELEFEDWFSRGWFICRDCWAELGVTQDTGIERSEEGESR